MTYNWSSAFEGYPTDADFGSVMGRVTRDIKGAFLERIEKEHNVSLESGAVVSHKPGECKVVKLLSSDESATSLLHNGALQFKDSSLYRDNGSSVDKVGAGSHSELSGLDDHDHEQFFRSTGQDDIDGAFEVPEITGLPTTENPPDDDVMSKSHENSDSSSGGAKHANEIISRDGLNIGMDKVKYQEETISKDASEGDREEYNLGDRSSMLFVTDSDSDGDSVIFECVETDHGDSDYNGRVQVHFQNDSEYEMKHLRMVD